MTLAPIFVLLMLVCSLASAAQSAETLRRFPYPYSHMVSVASDIDQQAPWHGAAIHRLINQELGLPISDSLWIQGASTDASSLFLGATDLNTRPAGIDGHTTFGLLLREWHRGNIDSFHSWQDDQTVPLRQHLATPTRLGSATTAVEVEAPPSALAAYYYRHLRLYFTAPPPEDLSLRLRSGDAVFVVGTAQVKAGKAVKADPARPPHFVEVLIGVPQDVGVPSSRDALNLSRLVRIELVAPSCAKGCETALTRIDRDGFSRRTVLLQLPTLEALNMRAKLNTAHGGWSFVQNFDAPGAARTMERKPGTNYEHPLVPNVLRSLADDRDTHGYHSDLLRDFGISSVWSYSRNTMHLWNEPVPAQRSTFRGFYDLIRTSTGNFSTATFNAFRRDVRVMDPALKDTPLDDIYCPNVCWGDQGAMLGLLIALTFTRIDSGKETDHLWYTHLATGDLEFKRSIDQPLRPSAVRWLGELANRHYNFNREVPAARRIWVAPAGTVATYRIVHPQIARHVGVERSTSLVTVRAWKDPVTDRVMPDPAAGTRDFHGVTLYVPDSARASLMISGKESRSFTRNPPDASGRPSITIVDDSTPTVLLDEIPLAANGTVRAEGGSWQEPSASGKEAPSGSRFGTLSVAAATAAVRWAPYSITLHNITHLRFSYRKTPATGQATTGRFFVELEMEDGSVVSASEDPAPANGVAASRWPLATVPDRNGWRHAVLDTAVLAWPAVGAGRRPPLPLGRVREMRFGLLDAKPGEKLDFDDVAALRPNGTNSDPEARKLVAGRIVGAGGKPASRVVVEAVHQDGRRHTTVTDRDGYYFFFRQKTGSVLAIGARTSGGQCAPLRGAMLDVRKDEAEIDVDLSRCPPIAPAFPS